MQSFVEGQFYGLELLTLPVASEIERARKMFMCEIFQLPTSTARNLVFVLFPCVPAVFLLAKRRLAFYKRAQDHQLDCVKESFLFDMTFFFPHQLSWTMQTSVILEELGITLDKRRMNLVECLETAVAPMRDIEELCFCHVRLLTEKTLSFFRLFPDAATARDFRTFLSGLGPRLQDLLILFLSSGLRWPFFRNPGKGDRCPLCACSFWSWEHFYQCPRLRIPARLFPVFTSAAQSGDWGGILESVRLVLPIWAERFPREEILYPASTLEDIFRS